MIEGRDIICFGNDWDGDPLSKKHIMVRLARRNRVLWINSIGNRNPTRSARDLRRMAAKLRQFASGLRQVADSVWVLAPIAVPFHGSAAARWINRRLLAAAIRSAAARLGFRDPITWSFLPSSAGVAGALGERLLVYHCVDEFSEFTGTDRGAILEMERQLVARADVQIVSSGPLYEAKKRLHPRTHLVTHGVDVEHFGRACDPATPVADELARLRRPVIGFFGLLADWVDLELVRSLAMARPRWSFALIGKADTDVSALQGLPNVLITGRRPYAELPNYCKGFDVAILPFVINTLTLAANPLKLREYLAAGLSVVATAIPEAERLAPHVRIARTRDQFLEQIGALLGAGSAGPQREISRSMLHESWDAKVEELGGIVASLIRVRDQVTTVTG